MEISNTADDLMKAMFKVQNEKHKCCEKPEHEMTFKYPGAEYVCNSCGALMDIFKNIGGNIYD